MKEFFKNDEGQLSMVRLQSLILVVMGVIYAFVYRDVVITSVLIGAGIGEKVSQKILGEK